MWQSAPATFSRMKTTWVDGLPAINQPVFPGNGGPLAHCRRWSSGLSTGFPSPPDQPGGSRHSGRWGRNDNDGGLAHRCRNLSVFLPCTRSSRLGGRRLGTNALRLNASVRVGWDELHILAVALFAAIVGAACLRGTRRKARIGNDGRAWVAPLAGVVVLPSAYVVGAGAFRAAPFVETTAQCASRRRGLLDHGQGLSSLFTLHR